MEQHRTLWQPLLITDIDDTANLESTYVMPWNDEWREDGEE